MDLYAIPTGATSSDEYAFELLSDAEWHSLTPAQRDAWINELGENMQALVIPAITLVEQRERDAQHA